MGRTRRPRAKTEGRWHPLRSSRATGCKLTGYIELFWAPTMQRWVSLPDVSRLADATGRVLGKTEELSCAR